MESWSFPSHTIPIAIVDERRFAEQKPLDYATPNRGYAHLRFAGAFAVVKRQSECGSKDRRNALQPANEHRRVLGAGNLFFF